MQRAIQVVNATFPAVEFTTWQQCERYLPHAQACAVLIEQEQTTFPEAASLLHQTGAYLLERSRPGEAQPLLQQALAMREQQLGFEHIDTASTVDRLALCFENQVRYEQAEPLFERALAIRQAQLGAQHPDTAQSLDSLAGLYENQGMYEQAEALYVRALAIYEQQLGPAHPQTLKVRGNYVAFLRAMGCDAEARALETKHIPLS